VREGLLVEGVFAGELVPLCDLIGECEVETVTRGLRPLLAAIQSAHPGSVHCTTFFFGLVDAVRWGALLEACGCCASLVPLGVESCGVDFTDRLSTESALVVVAWVRLE
jgi:hypothetical protein